MGLTVRALVFSLVAHYILMAPSSGAGFGEVFDPQTGAITEVRGQYPKAAPMPSKKGIQLFGSNESSPIEVRYPRNGRVRVLIFLETFSDYFGDFLSVEKLESLIQNRFLPYYQNASLGQLQIEYTLLKGVGSKNYPGYFILPVKAVGRGPDFQFAPNLYSPQDSDGLRKILSIELAKRKETLKDYDFVLEFLVHNNPNGTIGGFSDSIGPSSSAIDFDGRPITQGHVINFIKYMGNDDRTLGIAIHEFGHALGLGHSGMFNCGGLRQSRYERGNCVYDQYGNSVDIMGNAGARWGDLNVLAKIRMGWLSRDTGTGSMNRNTKFSYRSLVTRSNDPAGSVRVKIAPIEDGSGSSSISRGVEWVTVRPDGAERRYYIEYRRELGNDAGLSKRWPSSQHPSVDFDGPFFYVRGYSLNQDSQTGAPIEVDQSTDFSTLLDLSPVPTAWNMKSDQFFASLPMFSSSLGPSTLGVGTSAFGKSNGVQSVGVYDRTGALGDTGSRDLIWVPMSNDKNTYQLAFFAEDVQASVRVVSRTSGVMELEFQKWPTQVQLSPAIALQNDNGQEGFSVDYTALPLDVSSSHLFTFPFSNAGFASDSGLQVRPLTSGVRFLSKVNSSSIRPGEIATYQFVFQPQIEGVQSLDFEVTSRFLTQPQRLRYTVNVIKEKAPPNNPTRWVDRVWDGVSGLMSKELGNRIDLGDIALTWDGNNCSNWSNTRVYVENLRKTRLSIASTVQRHATLKTKNNRDVAGAYLVYCLGGYGTRLDQKPSSLCRSSISTMVDLRPGDSIPSGTKLDEFVDLIAPDGSVLGTMEVVGRIVGETDCKH